MTGWGFTTALKMKILMGNRRSLRRVQSTRTCDLPKDQDSDDHDDDDDVDSRADDFIANFCRQLKTSCAVLWKLLVAKDLSKALLNTEIPWVNILADMEIWGVGLDMEGCLQAHKVLGKKLGQFEKEAYKLAGLIFSLSTAADIDTIWTLKVAHTKGVQ